MIGRSSPQGPVASAGPKPPRQAKLLALVAFVGVPICIYFAYCFYLAGEAVAAFERWAEDMRARGIEVTYSAPRTRGIPLRIGIDVPDLVISDRRQDVVRELTLPRLSAEAPPWKPTTFTWTAPEPARLTAGAAALTITEMSGWGIADGPGLPRFSALASDLELSAPGQSYRAQSLAFDVLPAEPGDPVGDRFQVDLATIKLPGNRPPLGPAIERVLIEVEPTGDFSSGLAWPDRLFAWRDAGGTIEVRRLNFQYGPLSLDGAGTLALDGAGQPEAAFALRVRGFSQAIDGLRQRRWISKNTAHAAQLISRVLPTEQVAGGEVIKLALAIQERELSVGPVKLLTIPPIRWRRTPPTLP